MHIVSSAGLKGKLQRAQFKLVGPGPGLLQRLAGMHPSLVHAHFGPDATNALSLAAPLELPLVVTFHGYDATVADQYLPKLYLRRRELLKASSARFLCVSDYIRKKLIDQDFPAEKLQVHYTGIDTDYFRPDPAVERSPLVLFVGRLVAKKGCAYLVRAMAQVQRVLPEARLVVIGDGPLRPELEVTARATLRNFAFLGVQEPAAVRGWMNRARVFCTPSVTADSGDAEGFGMVFAEAQSMGLPVVSFASGGIPEAVAHDETGILAPERDWAGLARSISILLLSPEVWLQFSAAGQARVKRLFDLRTQALGLEDIYEDVLTEGRPTRAYVPSMSKRPVVVGADSHLPAAYGNSSTTSGFDSSMVSVL